MTLLQLVGGARPYFGHPGPAVFFVICGALFGVGCRGCDEPKAAAAPPPPAAKADPTAGLPQATTVDSQIAAEAAARLHDADTISFEQLQAKLEPAGVTFGPAKQLMAKKQLAIYCASADGTDGLIVTVCEYPSAEAAVNGEREANIFASQVAGHSSRARKKSVLHLIRQSTTPDATVEKVFAAFDALPDPAR